MTALGVFHRIWTSSHRDQPRAYCRSRRTMSSKRTRLRPSTCHRPVIPGLISRTRRRCHTSYSRYSYASGGRGPTSDMSLVGPRPPLAYEYREYDVWHRRRVLEIKPGITGLWQVEGRSRVRFDDMVRLDLQYARGWSLWLDVQILWKTPRAVMFGNGAY